MLAPERRAELRGLAESAQPFIRYGGTDPAAVYVLAAELAALVDAADERDRLAEAVERIEELATNAGYLIDGVDGLQVGAVLADDILRALDGTDDE